MHRRQAGEMKQVLQDRSGLTVVRDVPPPPCPPGSVLVRNVYSVISSGTEGSRIALAQKSLIGKARDRPDLVRQVIDRARREGFSSTYRAVQRKLSEETAVGYSSAGVILEVGEAVSGLRVGEHVACAGGNHANHAEVVSVPMNLCAPVPDVVPLHIAALTTLASISLHGIRLASVEVGDRVAVIGCGLIGQLACRLLRAAGAEVYALDVDERRIDQARQGGASHSYLVGEGVQHAVRQDARGLGVDAVLVTAASRTTDPLLLATEIARDRARLVLVGDVPVALPRESLYEKELSFRISRSYGPGRGDYRYEELGHDYPVGYVRWTEQRNMEAILELLARDDLRLDDLIDEVVPVDAAPSAYARLAGDAAARPLGAILLAYGTPAVSPVASAVHVTTESRCSEASRLRPARGAAPRIALIGPGSFAQRILVPALARAGARLEVVAGGAGPSAESALRRLGFARVAENAEAAILDPTVDAVVVATRHGLHADLVRQALAAGKHVFCEKPVALTLEDLEAVLAAAAGSEGILAVGFNRRFSPALARLRDFVGDSKRLVAHYRVSAGHLPDDHWLHDLEQGGGRILGEAGHFVDSLVSVTGSFVETVYAAGYGDPRLPVQASDNVALALRFRSGAVAQVSYAADGSDRLPKERLEVFAGSRTAILDDFRTLALYAPNRRRTLRVHQGKGHTEEIKAFIDGVRLGKPPVPIREIGNVTVATFCVIESLRTGLPVRIGSHEESDPER